MNSTELSQFLKGLEPEEVEHLFGELLSRHEWGTKITQRSWDGGVDVYGWYPRHNPQIRVGFDTKRYADSNLSSTQLETLVDKLDPDFSIDRYCIVVTADISNPVKRVADQCNIDIISRDGLHRLIDVCADDRILCEQYKYGAGSPTDELTRNQLRRRFERLGIETTPQLRADILDADPANTLIYEIERAAAGGESVALTEDDLFGGIVLPESIEEYGIQLARFPFELHRGRYWGGGLSPSNTPWAGKFKTAAQLPPEKTE